MCIPAIFCEAWAEKARSKPADSLSCMPFCCSSFFTLQHKLIQPQQQCQQTEVHQREKPQELAAAGRLRPPGHRRVPGHHRRHRPGEDVSEPFLRCKQNHFILHNKKLTGHPVSFLLYGVVSFPLAK